MKEWTTLEPIKCPEFNTASGICHSFFTREGGVSRGIYSGLNCGLGSKDDITAVTENRRLAALSLSGGKISELNSLAQVHGTKVVEFPFPGDKKSQIEGDAAVTNQPGIILSILTADCAPVLLADEHKGVIGACHAGWRGALSGIIERTVLAMEALGSNRKKISAVIGPCISAHSYKVGIDLRDRFTAMDPWNAIFFIPNAPEKYLFDLSGFIKLQLNRSNVRMVTSIDSDTFSKSETFFSYRRSLINGDPDYGRMISAIMLE